MDARPEPKRKPVHTNMLRDGPVILHCECELCYKILSGDWREKLTVSIVPSDYYEYLDEELDDASECF